MAAMEQTLPPFWQSCTAHNYLAESLSARDEGVPMTRQVFNLSQTRVLQSS